MDAASYGQEPLRCHIHRVPEPHRLGRGEAGSYGYELMVPKQAAGGVMLTRPDSCDALSW